ncbi:energy transducer TonB family protein [Sphingomonas sp.]|uniref:energy transducer TonB family protein n=1 Tax=Sphingomonas sp. TaxID=28214 RepID=UPI003D6CEA93
MIQNFPARAFSLSLATTMHLVIGWALISRLAMGVPVRGEADRSGHDALVVELIPLDAHGQLKAMAGDAAGTRRDHHAQPQPLLQNPPQGGPVTHDLAGGPEIGAPMTVAAAATRGSASADLPNAELLAYRARLEAHLARFRTYPAGARSAGQEGVVHLRFLMDHDGRVIDAWVEASSGIGDIDREALASVMRAQPLPALPSGWPDRMDISLPIQFEIG